jgi:hypothetical protein
LVFEFMDDVMHLPSKFSENTFEKHRNDKMRGAMRVSTGRKEVRAREQREGRGKEVRRRVRVQLERE